MYFVWGRPSVEESDVPYENIWLKFNAKDLDTNEQVSYKIQDLQEYRFGDAINFLTEYYLNNEAIMASKGIATDEKSLKQLHDFWYLILSQKMSLVCYRESARDIVAVSLLCVLTKKEYNERKYDFEEGPMKEVADFNHHFQSQFNILEKYNVDKYLASYGMAVSPNYRARGIATEMLRARLPLARAFDIKLTSTAFTSIDSQIPAYKVGFKTDYELSFEEVEGQGHKFPGIKSKTIKQMSLEVD